MNIILMGTSKSGKSSIKKVVFEKTPQYELTFFEPTLKIESLIIESKGYYKIKIIEFPSSFNYNKMTIEEEEYFDDCKTIIFVLDTQFLDENVYNYFENNVVPIIKKKRIYLNIFLHKFDKINSNKFDEEKIKNIIYEIIQKNTDKRYIPHNFYKTSIYNYYSLLEDFSIIYKNHDIIPQSSFISGLLDTFACCSKLEKIYLFDVNTKINLAESFDYKKYLNIFKICVELIDIVLITKMIKKDSLNNESSCLLKCVNLDKEKIRFYFKFINNEMALIFCIKEQNYEKRNLFNYNLNLTCNGIKNFFNK